MPASTDMTRLMARRAEIKADGDKARREYEAGAKKMREKTERLKALRQAQEEAEQAAKPKKKPAARKKRVPA